jgi:plastocyanin
LDTEVNHVRLARTTLLIAGAALIIAAASACGGDDDDDGGDATAASSPTRGATAAAGGTLTTGATTVATAPAGETAPAGGRDEITVVAADNSFDPTEFEATVGTEVELTLENEGAASHTLTIYEDEAYTTAFADGDTGQVAGGEEADLVFTFTEAKTYYYRCENHPAQMEGEITVE